ncbi:MAG: 3-ketoacyl-ACP synthase [Chloroflexi bacterium GWB2_49_20]|nr:MAG: 3-ketoacyl-ACP synthase [Chloroflexi bacterium GWB2_49_20]OGN79939.1 MAG: 3-ketoacyl-ACP synthase [Chloroflexi bacterium GWC2_49_37]OGN85526.1 MAG: 3-ketoacyl-ACP synthase [Chloroflexi bacterium GWD2_49_16]HBG74400.1 ketoacyl-ACP synthase III [Anaerolineae bacterium]HCM96990.1 ketoacyl-ACP synthase III [Anaerolineae bacterium]
MVRHPQILATGSYVPERVVSNAEVDALMGESTNEWLLANVGIRERRWMSPEQTTSDLIVEASRKALNRAGINANELDMIIVSTDTPDYLSPATSIVVQYKLGSSAGCYDVNSACAGWVTALDQGARYLMTEPSYNNILVAGGYGMSRFLDFNDKKTANLFADGAGAVVLGVGDTPGFVGSNFLAVGAFHDALGIYTGGANRPCTPENLATFGPPKVEFVRKFPKTFNTEYWPKLMQGALDKGGLTFDDVDKYFFTQLNLRTIEFMMTLLNQSIEKTHWIMDKWGYTGSPCVVMALDDAISQGKGPKAGETILFCASGGGISMASSVWKWTAK